MNSRSRSLTKLERHILNDALDLYAASASGEAIKTRARLSRVSVARVEEAVLSVAHKLRGV